jgi:hypothetical protein
MIRPTLPEDAFERRYEDVLQNIEFGIMKAYREHPEMSNWEALNAIEELIRIYNAEVKGYEVHPPHLDPISQDVFDSVKMICEWRLGRNLLQDQDNNRLDVQPEPITLDETIDCLKRIRKSINFWTQEAGRKGYLNFIENFF